MSYLSFPRLAFAGKFQADPSTINNDPGHFDTSRFRANYQLEGNPTTWELPGGITTPGMTNGWWNPRGSGAWRFYECKVSGVIYSDGSTCQDPRQDLTVGASINSTDRRVEGKLVDLDPEQQMVSEIWGFQVGLDVTNAAYNASFGFLGSYEASPFIDIFMRYPQGQSDSWFGAFYQSVLHNLAWFDIQGESIVKQSRFLQELLANGKPSQLSIHFNTDGYDDDTSSPWFTFGRVVGTIGLYVAGEPKRLTPARRFVPTVPFNGQTPSSYSLGYGIAQLDTLEVNGSTQHVLQVDLGNCLTTASAGGPLADLGALTVQCVPTDGAPIALGTIDYQSPGWYTTTAGIQVLPLTAAQVDQLQTTPLGLYTDSTQSPQPQLLREQELWVRADQFVFRLQPGSDEDTAVAELYAVERGEPLRNRALQLSFYNDFATQQQIQGPVAGPAPGTPESALQFDTSVQTNQQGTARVVLRSQPPGNPRGYIDGQVYGVKYAPQDPATASDVLNVLVFDAYQGPDVPTWLDDVAPIFRQYANLYPVMKPIVDLANYASVLQCVGILKNVFSAPVSHPNYMPVTRDLSPNKRRMIRAWLDSPLYMRCSSVQEVRAALQQAVELEHATLPPYLTALYSIKPGRNVEVAAIIQSIVMEEMLHMALAANLLVSIGGSPRIGYPGFVPNCPGPLPGGLRGDLTVQLRRCSITQIRDVFLSIEEPSETIETVDGTVGTGNPVESHAFTIGWFYDRIAQAIKELCAADKLTFGNLDRQVEGHIGPHHLYKINSLDRALQAIAEIQRQGEGNSPLNPDEGPDQVLSHFYKFSEIVYGRRIVIHDHSFSFDGEAIPFDSDGVYPMVDDPDTSTLTAGTPARILSEQFNQTYQALLNALHATFNGEPGKLGEAVGVMYALNLAARKLMQTPIDPKAPNGATAGPSFQLPFPY